jgi:glutamine cyclotransferase
MRRWVSFCVLWLAIGVACGQQSSRTPEYTFRVVHQFPHDASAFTQGLAYRDGFFYEGTGLNGRSSLRKVEITSGKVLQKTELPADYFGEGIAILKDRMFQLTWQSQTALVYDLKSFRRLRQFSYPGEGWGLATDGRELFMSDGSSEIRVLDPTTFVEKRRIKVREGKKPITQLNELEYVEGVLLANVWQTDRIARISPTTGQVLGWIDLKGLLSPMYAIPPEAVLNGIAYDSQGKRLFVTGKLWPAVFEIRVVPRGKAAFRTGDRN